MITVYTRNDLKTEAIKSPIDETEGYDFRYSLDPIRQADMVVFFDDDGQFKILKNRYEDDDPRTKELLYLIGITCVV